MNDAAPNERKPRNSVIQPRRTLWLLLVVALVLRVSWILSCPNEPVSDQIIYDFSARQLAMGHGYIDERGFPANYWPVGYSALLGAAYWLFGSSYTTAFLLNVCLWLLIVATGFQLALMLYGQRAAAIFGGLLAIYPTFVLSTTLFLSEIPFIAGELLILLAIVAVAQKRIPPWWTAVGIGLGIGLLTYVRPPALALVAVPALFLWAARWTVLQAFGLTTLVLTCTLLTLTPWGLRNKQLFGHFDMIAQNGGSNLWMGNNPATDGNYMPPPTLVATMGVAERDRFLKKEAVDYIVAYPGLYLVRSAKRLVSSLSTDTIAVHWNITGIERYLGQGAVKPLKLVCTLSHYSVLVLAALSLYRRRPRRWPDLPLLVTAGLLSLPFVLIVGGNRYILPLVPLLMLIVSGGIRGIKPQQER